MLPTFIVIGAMKTGTSSLARYLASHPDVFMTTPKEPGFFSFRWDLGVEWYESLFDAAGAAAARGEASTNYTKAPHVPHVPERMLKVLPDVKLVYVVRDPVDRIRSQYVHNVAHRGETRPLAVAVRDNPEYVDFGRYAFQVEPFVERYGSERILVVASERLKQERAATLSQVFRFIDVADDATIAIADQEFNRGDDKRRLAPGVERFRLFLNRIHVVDVFPEPVRRWVFEKAQRQRIEARVDGGTAAWIWEQVGPDLARLPSLVGFDPDLWVDRRA